MVRSEKEWDEFAVAIWENSSSVHENFLESAAEEYQQDNLHCQW